MKRTIFFVIIFVGNDAQNLVSAQAGQGAQTQIPGQKTPKTLENASKSAMHDDKELYIVRSGRMFTRFAAGKK